MLGPIFAREWLTLPRRSSHYGLRRTAFLGMLWVLGLTVWQAMIGWERQASLGDLARFGLVQFQVLVYFQLLLVLFFAALAAASTITQEKDRRTFVLLLLTDLHNHEIVLGKLVGSLLQIGLLLLATFPIYCLSLFLGGIDGRQIIQAVIVLAATALAAGSLGGLVALWREKTFQALALTVLFLVLYLSVVECLGLIPHFTDEVSSATISRWQQYLQPFLALQTVVAPVIDDQDRIPAAYGFALAMLAISCFLNLWGMMRLRRWNPSGEPVMQREHIVDQEVKNRASAHAASGSVRRVWPNPILWREIATRAYGRRPLLIKFAYFLVLALVCYYALADTQSREWVAARGLVPVAILSLLLISAQAVTAITSERDTGALDLLLVTDLTPREFIFGKLGGIAWNTKEFWLPPLLLAAIYAWRGSLATPDLRLQRDQADAFLAMSDAMNLEAYLAILIGGIVLQAFTMVLGLHIALRISNTRLAVIHSLGTIFFLSVGTLICIYLILINGRFESQWLSFILFLGAGISGLWWVLSADRPSTALTIASWLCPLAVFYAVTDVTIGNPILQSSTDPLKPLLFVICSFGFTIAAMLVPLLSEFDVALGRTTGGVE